MNLRRIYGLGFFYENIFKKFLGINTLTYLNSKQFKVDFLVKEELLLDIHLKKDLDIKELIFFRTLGRLKPWGLRRKSLGLPCRGQRTKTNAKISKSKFTRKKPVTFKQKLGEKKKRKFFPKEKKIKKFIFKGYRKKSIHKRVSFKKKNWSKKRY